MYKAISILIISSFLGACSVYKTDFECEAGKGLSCKSLSQVNELHEQGRLEPGAPFNSEYLNTTETPHTQVPAAFFKGSMMRTPESIQRIWLAGYEDSEGVYHGPKYIYVVVKKSHWAPYPGNKEKSL